MTVKLSTLTACEPSSARYAVTSAEMELIDSPTANASPFGREAGSSVDGRATTTAIPAATAVICASLFALTERAPESVTLVSVRWASTVLVIEFMAMPAPIPSLPPNAKLPATVMTRFESSAVTSRLSPAIQARSR